MSADRNYPAPFDRANFIFPTEWQSLSDLLGAGEVGLLVLQEGVIAHANGALCEQLGYTEEELIGLQVERLFPRDMDEEAPPSAPAQGDRLRLLAHSGIPVVFDRIDNHFDPLSNASSTVWALLPAGRRLAPDTYSSEATQARAILDYLPDLVCVCNPDTSFTYVNQALYTLLGYDADELEGVRLIDLTHQDDRALLLDTLVPLSEAELGAGSPSFTLRLRHNDSSWRHVLAQARNLGPHHAVAGILINGRDITTHKLQQQSIATEKKRQLHYLNRLLRIAQRPHANLNSALTVVLKSATRALGTHRCAYWQINEVPEATRCVMAYDDLRQNFVDESPDALFARSFHPLLYRLQHGEDMLMVGDVDQDPRTAPHCEYFQASGIKAAIVVPVQSHDGPVGLLTLFHYREPRHWRRDEGEFAENVARLIGLIVREVEHAKQEAQLRQLAHHDSLTGLPNRQFLYEQADDLPALAGGANTLAAFFIDLDGFKRVNDTRGHAVGDELLKAAALRLKNVVRKDDILVRLGGDEFMLLARNISDMRIADDIAKQIVDTMRNTFSLRGSEVRISASVGIAMYPQDGTDVETLMKKADIAMYQAKSAGRDRYHMFSPSQADVHTERRMLESELRRAIEEHELRHYYQPQIDLKTGKVVCVEALLRWHHPKLGVLLPERFLPMAEETGLINSVSAWVLDDACQQLRTWEKAGLNGFSVAINLSPSQLMDRALIPALERALERNDIPAARLEWEISEATALQHNTLAASMFERAAEMEVGLVIDDFGTGQTSLSSLRLYPVRKVKIDGRFISGLPEEKEKRTVTDAILLLARPLGLKVVAEGVETPEQLEYLREHGCDSGQGFLFAHPLRADQFEMWMTRH